MAKIEKKLIVPIADKNVDQQELSFNACGNAKWHSHFGSLVVSCKAKHRLNI